MNSDNQKIVLLVVSGSFFLSIPFFLQNKIEKAQNLSTDTVVIKRAAPKIKKQKSQRLPASKSPYSINDFKPKNLLNKKILTEQEYNDALEASKHVGISYELPDPKLDYKLTSADLAEANKIVEAIYVAKSQRNESREKQAQSGKK